MYTIQSEYVHVIFGSPRVQTWVHSTILLLHGFVYQPYICDTKPGFLLRTYMEELSELQGKRTHQHTRYSRVLHRPKILSNA